MAEVDLFLTDDDLQPPHETVSIMEIADQIRNDPRCRISAPIEYQGKVLKQIVREIPLDKIRIEKAYQRNPNIPHILDIIGSFDPRSMMIPMVVQRNYNGGEIVSPEGQQRLIGAAVLGFKGVSCNVVEANSIEEEAVIFERINIHRKTVPTPVTHRNRVIQRDANALRLERTVREAGYTIGERDRNLVIKGISRLHTTGRAYSYPILGKALEAYRTIWPDHTQVHLYLNSGIAMLLFTYLSPESPTYRPDTERDVDPDLLAARIRKRLPNPKAAINFVGPDTHVSSAIKRQPNFNNPLMTGARLNETFRRENDFFYAKALITAFNTGGKAKSARYLDLQRVYETYIWFKQGKPETFEGNSVDIAAMVDTATVTRDR